MASVSMLLRATSLKAIFSFQMGMRLLRTTRDWWLVGPASVLMVMTV